MSARRTFVDTNVFLRYLTDDVPAQADAVEALLGRAARGEVVLVTNALVMAELVWTLESYYHVPRGDIKDKVVGIVATPGIVVTETTWFCRQSRSMRRRTWTLPTPTMRHGCSPRAFPRSAPLIAATSPGWTAWRSRFPWRSPRPGAPLVRTPSRAPHSRSLPCTR